MWICTCEPVCGVVTYKSQGGLVKCKPGEPGQETLRKQWLVDTAKEAETIALQYALGLPDKRLHNTLLEAKRIIPEELTVCGTIFTAVAAVGDLQNGHNHKHVDSNDIISLIIQVGKGVTGGKTTYYDGSNVNKNDVEGPCEKIAHQVPFMHGTYQIGPFENVVHEGEPWKGKRGGISFYLNAGIMEHFKTYGQQPYDDGKDTMYAPKAKKARGAVRTASTHVQNAMPPTVYHPAADPLMGRPVSVFTLGSWQRGIILNAETGVAVVNDAEEAWPDTRGPNANSIVPPVALLMRPLQY